jgi:ABC-type multidrug transport system ATPase subunit
MKADHILVVMNGEIIEEGSHDDLIRSKGKYHDLWSKQIFVEPTTDRSTSRSPKKRDADIINDLTPNQPATESAKVHRTTEHEDSPKSEETDVTSGNSSGTGEQFENGHKREVS